MIHLEITAQKHPLLYQERKKKDFVETKWQFTKNLNKTREEALNAVGLKEKNENICSVLNWQNNMGVMLLYLNNPVQIIICDWPQSKFKDCGFQKSSQQMVTECSLPGLDRYLPIEPKPKG